VQALVVRWAAGSAAGSLPSVSGETLAQRVPQPLGPKETRAAEAGVLPVLAL